MLPDEELPEGVDDGADRGAGGWVRGRAVRDDGPQGGAVEEAGDVLQLVAQRVDVGGWSCLLVAPRLGRQVAALRQGMGVALVHLASPEGGVAEVDESHPRQGGNGLDLGDGVAQPRVLVVLRRLQAGDSAVHHAPPHLVRVQQDVPGVQVVVHDALPVQTLQQERHLQGHAEPLDGGERGRLHPVTQRVAVGDQPEDEGAVLQVGAERQNAQQAGGVGQNPLDVPVCTGVSFTTAVVTRQQAEGVVLQHTR